MISFTYFLNGICVNLIFLCWRRLLTVPWTARRSNQSILNIHWNIHWKDWCWSRNSNTLVTWCKELTHLKRPCCWERLKAGGEGDTRGCDGQMASPMRWTGVWINSGSWWWTGWPGVLQSMRSQWVGHYWTTELNWIFLYSLSVSKVFHMFHLISHENSDFKR